VSQIVNLDSSPPADLYFRVAKLHKMGDMPTTGCLALVSKVWDSFPRYLRKQRHHKFHVDEELPIHVWWGEYSRQATGKDEFYDSLSLRHQGWGKQTLGLLGPNIGSIVDIAVGGNTFGTAQTVAELAADQWDGKMHCATPTERKNKQMQIQQRGHRRGDVKRAMFRDLKHNLNIGHRFFIAITTRANRVMAHDKKKRLLTILEPGQHEMGDLLEFI
jgi:hypothetical protein